MRGLRHIFHNWKVGKVMINKLKKKLLVLILLIIIGIGFYYTWMNFFSGATVKLYFATKDGMYLDVEKRQVRGDKVVGALEELVVGPQKSNLSATIPPGVEVLNVKLADGLAIVNFNEKLVTNHWGGSTGELLTIYSIVNTLGQFSQIERVQILVEGQKIETLAGHFLLEESLEVKEELIK